MGEALLAGTGVSLGRWQAIATAILEKKDPGLSPEEQKSLVDKGILRVKVAFGGES